MEILKEDVFQKIVQTLKTIQSDIAEIKAILQEEVDSSEEEGSDSEEEPQKQYRPNPPFDFTKQGFRKA